MESDVNADGIVTYGNIISLKANIDGFDINSVYPSPFVDKFQVTVLSEKSKTITVKLFDSNGKKIRSETQNIQNGSTKILINNLSALQKGLYYLELIQGEIVLTKSLVK